MNPPLVSGSKSDGDPQEFLNMVEKVTDIMGVSYSETKDLGAY